MTHSGATPTTADVETLICATATKISGRYFPSRLTALVVTGSTARGESSVREHPNGTTILGDLELVIVTTDGSSIPGLKEAVREELFREGIECEVSAMFCSKHQLLGMPASVFTYELRECGKVLVGEPTLLSKMPSIQRSDLPLEDAWRMLGNRAVELLEALSSPELVKQQTGVGYRVAKLYLDICTSLLIFTGDYEPSYRARAEKLAENVVDISSRVHTDLSEFALLTRRALDAKLSGAAIESFASPVDVRAVIHLLQTIGSWELSRMCEGLGSVDAFMASRTLQTRVRGWAAVVSRVGVQEAAVNAYRWSTLSRRGSPRHLIYKVAFELLGAHENASPQQLMSFNRLLPLPAGGQLSWSAVAQSTAANYHRFVEVTRS